MKKSMRRAAGTSTLLIAFAASLLCEAATNMWSASPRFPSRRYTPIISLNLDPQESADTALRIAARDGNSDRIDDALKRGAKVNSRSIEGTTALMYAARGCYTKTVKYLLDLGAKVNMRDKKGRSALLFAVRGSCLPAVRLLIGYPGIDLSRRDHNNRTIQDVAASAALLDVDGPSVEILSLVRSRMRKASLAVPGSTQQRVETNGWKPRTQAERP